MKNHSDAREPSVSEDDCVVRGQWPEAARESVRILTDRMPLEGVCDACSVFLRSLGFFDLFRQPTKH